MVRGVPLHLLPGHGSGSGERCRLRRITDQEVKLITEANEAYVLKFKTLELLQKLQAWLLGQS